MRQPIKYLNLKGSNIEYIGDIPKHWDIVSFKYLISDINSGTSLNQVEDETEYKVTRIETISSGEIDYSRVGYVQYDKRLERYKLKIGDILFSNINSLSMVGNAAMYEGERELYSGMNLIRIQPQKGVNPKWLYYMIISNPFNQHVKSIAQHAINQVSVPTGRLKELPSIMVPLNEQEIVASFLDNKISEIDSLIADKEKLIELLEEKRQAIITETVTKGLNPDVKMKDSGVDWIGKIPEHWDLVKLKYLTNQKLLYGANESAELDEKKLPRFIRITDIDKKGNLKEETFKSLPVDKAKGFLLESGDILLARSGATVGKAYYHKDDIKACFAGYLIRFRANREMVHPKLVYYFTQSSSYSHWIEENTIQATIENVSAEKYANLSIPLPKWQEQEKLIKYIEEKEEDVWSVLSNIKEQVKLLKKYRQSLIYEAVTGKIDVRDHNKVTS